MNFQKYKFTFPADDLDNHHYPLREDRIYGRHPPMMDPDAFGYGHGQDASYRDYNL